MKFTPQFISVYLLLIPVLIFLPAALNAQQNPEWIVFNTGNSGLPDDQVNDIIIDDNNVIWIGTDSGIARFDGSWKIFNTSNSGLPIHSIESILIDKKGNKWTTAQEAYGEGFAKFNDKTWTIYGRSNSELPSDVVNTFALDSIGNKWLGTDEGLVKYDGKNWIAYNVYNSKLPGNLVFALEIDSEGNIWVGTNEGLAKFDGTNWTIYTDSNSGLPCNHIWDLATDVGGNIWIATENCGFAKFDGITWTVFNESNSELPDNEIIALSNVINGTIWVGTEGRGLSKFQNNTWTNYHVLNSGLPNDIVSNIYIDRKGNKWICTQGGGLAVYKEGGIDIQGNPAEIQLFFNSTKPVSLKRNDKHVLPPNDIFKEKGYSSKGQDTEIHLNEHMSAVHQDIHFDRISVQEGLSQSTTRCIYQDSKGFMWFGTDDGLNKYDGYQFSVFKHDPDNPNSLRSNRINSINEDKLGFLWFETTYGVLHKFDRETETFTPYKNDKNDIISLKKLPAYVDTCGTFWIEEWGLRRYRNKLLPRDGNSSDFSKFIYIDDSGGWWIGTDGSELEKFWGDHKSTKHYGHSPYNSNSLSHDEITSIVKDNFGQLWIGTINGLNKLNPQEDKITRYLYQPGIVNTLTVNRINAICQTNSGELWIGTHGAGLYNFNLKTEKFMHYVHDSNDPKSLSNNVVLSIYEDRSGVIWIGTYTGGINRFNPNQKKFSHHHHDPENPNSLSCNMITSVYEDNTGFLWIGTDGGGLNRINTDGLDNFSPIWTHYKNDLYNPNSISGDRILSIYQDKLGVMWFGTNEGGLNKFIHSTNEKISGFIHYKHFPGNPRSLIVDEVTCIYEDNANQLWIGTGRGLNKFNRQTETFIRYSSDSDNPITLSNDGITCILEDKKGNFWVGTEDGLNKFDRQKETVIRYIHDPDNPNSRIYNEITSIYEDKSGTLWIGTANGLKRFDHQTGVFSHFKKKDGLPNNFICGILEDDDKKLWLSTRNGLSQYSPQTGNFTNFDRHDGLQSNEFNSGAFYKTNTGRLFFGGVNGLSFFYPKESKDNLYTPSIVITDFQISNLSVPIGSPFIEKSISEAKEIQLSFEERVFSFEFAALDYQNPEKNQYAYMLEGFDKDWNYTDAKRRFATYTNLDPGEYVFRVKGSNNDGRWNEAGTSINLTITPPWWRTNLAYAGYLLLFALTLYALRTYDQKRHRLKHDLELEHLQTDKLKEVDHMKSRFFANISHEFRTPLTLIKGPAKQIMAGDFNGSLKEKGKMILHNSDRLLSLINQILDLSKLDSGQIKLQVTQTEIIGILKGLVLSFSSLADQKKISLVFDAKVKSLTGYIDRDKFEKIVTNLLSNAFKFTPEHGEIIFECGLRITEKSKIQYPISKMFFMAITNTGPEMPPDQLDKIFDRFYQAETSYKKDGEGSGIGLALTKELVELHHGTIGVECGRMEKQPPESTFSKGELCPTTFIVSLPVGKSHLKEDEITEGHLESSSPIPYPTSGIQHSRLEMSPSSRHVGMKSSKISQASSIEYRVSSIPSPASRLRSPSVLIVEDNQDVIQYICSILEMDYRLISAENGKAGMEKALETHPDIIISDVMMPEMGGFEFCQKVKSDERISHIPVILLTAKADLESKIEGLEFGADDYISKPFDAEELKIRIKNLLEQRQRLWRQYQKNNDFDLLKNRVASTDEVFLDRVRKVIDQHIDDPEFNVKKLSVELGISRRHLSRKFESLTGDTALIFIRRIRLARAVELLQQNGNNIVNISYDVGFTTPSYFAKCFRRQYGLNPSEYAAQYSRNGKIS